MTRPWTPSSEWLLILAMILGAGEWRWWPVILGVWALDGIFKGLGVYR